MKVAERERVERVADQAALSEAVGKLTKHVSGTAEVR